MKRTLDVIVATMVLVLSVLPAIVVAGLIKLSSPGPIFFKQIRVGRGGKPFALYKFRTMTLSERGPMVTAEEDSRITRIGKYLRKWKIDELPQFINVLKGDMSLIGPRPETERFVQLYSPEQRNILEPTPGLAGMAQLVYPHEAELLKGHPDPEEAYISHIMPMKIQVDLEYERRRTFWSDIFLLLELGLLVLGKSFRRDRNAYLASAIAESRVKQSETDRNAHPVTAPSK